VNLLNSNKSFTFNPVSESLRNYHMHSKVRISFHLALNCTRKFIGTLYFYEPDKDSLLSGVDTTIKTFSKILHDSYYADIKLSGIT